MAIKRKPKVTGSKTKKKTTTKAVSSKSAKVSKTPKKTTKPAKTMKKAVPKKSVSKVKPSKKIVKKTTKAKPVKKVASKVIKKKTATSAKAPKKSTVVAKAKKVQTTKPKVKTTKVERTMAVATKSRDKTSTGFLGIPPYKEKSGESYMNTHQRTHFRNLLTAWKQALMEEADRTMTHLKHDVVNYPDPSDRASQEEEFTLELRERDRERKLIAKIDEALGSIEKEEYGFCEVCGVDIGIRRLEARPTATLCIDCKTLDEMREKQTRL